MNFEGQYLFTKVVEYGSFTGAANALGMPKSAVSQKIKKLEEELNTKLILRTTRALKLTAIGEAFYEKTKAMLSKALEAERVIDDFQGIPSGILRVAAGVDMGHLFLFDALTHYSKNHPKITLETHWTNLIRDEHLENFDICFKLGPISETHYTTALVYEFELGIFATKQFLSENPNARDAKHPNDLKALPWISYRTNRYNRPLHWKITLPSQESFLVNYEAKITVNSVHACANLMLLGAGLAVVPKVYIEAYPSKDGCENILPNWSFPKGEIFALFKDCNSSLSKIRNFIDQLKAS